MGQRILASFANLESCCDAEARLRAEGYSPVRQFSVTGTGPAAPEPHQLPDAVQHHGGEWTILICPVFGRARRALQILETSGAIAVREEPEGLHTDDVRHDEMVSNVPIHTRELLPDQSFFVSSLLGIPLLFNCAAPLSRVLGLPTLIRSE